MAAQRGDESTISVKRTGRVAVLLAHRHALAELGGLGRGALAAGTAADFRFVLRVGREEYVSS